MPDRFCVLIVEDDHSIQLLLEATLPDQWVLVTARDGLEALAVARDHRPDAVVLDHHLPLLSGVEVCEVLRQQAWAADCRIVALTGSEDASVRSAFSRAGADAFLTKPFSPVQLLELLSEKDPSRA